MDNQNLILSCTLGIVQMQGGGITVAARKNVKYVYIEIKQEKSVLFLKEARNDYQLNDAVYMSYMS